MDLRKYSEQVNDDIARRQTNLVQSYVEQHSQVGVLYQEVSQAVTTLERLETVLGQFGTELGSISSEITEIQRQSLSMLDSVGRRKQLQTQLSEYLQEVKLTPSFVNGLLSSPIDHNYCSFIHELRHKLSFFHKNQFRSSEHTPLSMLEVLPELRNFSQRAAFRILGFFIFHFQSLSKASSNLQRIQEETLLRNKDLVLFLRDCEQNSYSELCVGYLEAINPIYLSYFRSYCASMRRLVKDTRPELVIEDEPRGFFSSKSTTKTSVFDLKDRHTILTNLENLQGIITKNSLRIGEKFDLERVFHSLLLLLADSYSYAYFFISDFFAVNHEQFLGIFRDFFKPVLDHVMENISQVISENNDVFAIVLMVRITDYFSKLMLDRRIPSLTTFFEKTKALLWPRFQYLLDSNIKALESGKIRVSDINPHPTILRFCQLIKGLTCLKMKDDMFRLRVNLLNKTFIQALENASLQLRDLKNRSVFMINNLDCILEACAKDGLDSTIFESAFRMNESQFVELQLSEVFGPLLDFVEAKSAGKVVDASQVEVLQSDLKVNWRKHMGLIRTIAVDFFATESCQRELLRETFTRLVMKYTEFADVVKRDYPALCRDLVAVQTVMHEVQALTTSSVI